MRLPLALHACLAVATLLGCGGGNDDPNGAAQLWTRLHSDDYHAFPRAPGHPGKVPSSSPHGDQVEIWVNATVQSAIDAKAPLAAWPDGALIVKDGFKGGALTFVVAMEKRGTAWYWAEYDADGTVEYSGAPSVCTNCHASGADFVRSFALPK